ncbi:MAG: extracellular solute-binding protein [Candidatus Methylacidiphilales bacterium]|nr:extracellular solute-binding protein [Candidatus Methylacidiphilales bacterium]
MLTSQLRLCLTIAALLMLAWLLHPPSSSQSSTDDGAVEIHYLGSSGPLSGAMEDAVRLFEEESARAHLADPSKPVYRVTISTNTSKDLTADPTRFIISVAGGMPPDVLIFDRFAVAEWSSRGVFQPLDEYIKRDIAAGRPDAIRAEDYFAPAWNEVSEGPGGVFGIPIDIDTRALYYNKDLLVRAGYVDEKGQARPPRTWEELEEMAVKLTERDNFGRITRLGFAPNFGNSWLYLYAWMNGGEMMSADRTRVTMNDPRVVGALEYITRIYDKLGGAQAVYGFQNSFQSGALDPFITSQVVMKIATSSEISSSFAQYGRNLNYGVAPAPLPASEIARGAPNVSWMGGFCYAIPATAKNKDAAWELVRFLASDSTRRIVAESERLTMESQGRVYVPVQVSKKGLNEERFQQYVFSRPEVDSRLKDAVRAFNGLIESARYRPVTPVGQLLWNEHVAATENAIFKRMSPREALEASTRNVQARLDKILHPKPGPIINWNWFFVGYALLIIALTTAIYLWDARKGGAAGGTEQRASWLGGWVSASPWILGFIIFTAGPMLFSLIISFCRYDAINEAVFIGPDNYIRMFTADSLFGRSIGNTLFMVIGVILGNALSLAMAVLLTMKVRGIAVWRTFFYIPSIVPMVASSILWIWILDPNTGLINGLLALLGIHGPSWLQDPNTSKISLILMGLWTAGGGIMIWIAGLKGISESYYEAAMLDGASTWQQFRHITVPLLSPYIFFNLVIGIIATLQIFTQAFVMTQGGPANSTLFYVYHLFNNAFRYLDMGYAAAMAWVLFIVVLLLTLLQMKLSERWVHYEGD